MARVAAAIASLMLNLPGAAALLGGSSVLRFDVAAAKERPAAKVVGLLKDMKQQLEKQAEEDEDVYDKLACWCTTNDKEKTQSIAEAQARIADLTTRVEELSAGSARLRAEIKHLRKELAKNQDSLDKATALRQQQLAAFNAEEKDLLGSISALKSALTVLSKHHSSLLQVEVPRTHLLGVAATLQHELQQHASLLEGVLTHSERKAAAAFIQSPYQSYAPQSGAIFGILNSMHETFQNNLAASQKDELSNQKAFEDLKAAKEGEIAAGKDQLNIKTVELANSDEKLAHSKVDIEDTKNSLSTDEQFLLMLKEKCQLTDKEWAERQKTRQQEIEAVSKALSLLTADDAHDLFTRTFNPAFLQNGLLAHSERRQRASKLLSAVAERLHNRNLAQLAQRVQLDGFERVKKAIGDMVTQLLKEKENEIKKRDFCIDEFNTNQKQTEAADRQKQSLIAKIEDLSSTIKSLADDIDSLKAEIAEMQKQLKRAGENREKENKEFQLAVSDQRETQKLLAAALEVLGDFYAKKSMLLQQQTRQAPPAGFDEYKKSGASSSVMGLLQQIIEDSKKTEAEIVRSEEDGQKAYEDFVKDTNASIETKGREITNKAEDKAKTEKDLVSAKESKESVLLELEQLSVFNAQLHQSCDFVLKNFELRQTARDEEVEALRQAVAILSGAKFEAFVQGQ